MKKPEALIHEAILSYLRVRYGSEDCIIHHSPNEVDMRGPQAARMVAKARQLGTTKGWPDIEMLYQGRFWTFEVKAKGNYATPDQKACGALIEAAGGRWTVVRSIDDVQAAIEVWLDEGGRGG